MDLRETDPEMFRARVDEVRGGLAVLEAVRAFRAADQRAKADPAAATARDQAHGVLRAALTAQFDQRLRVQQLEAARLEEHLQAVKREVESRVNDREQIINDLMHAVERGEGPGPRGVDPR